MRRVCEGFKVHGSVAVEGSREGTHTLVRERTPLALASLTAVREAQVQAPGYTGAGTGARLHNAGTGARPTASGSLRQAQDPRFEKICGCGLMQSERHTSSVGRWRTHA
eukprot:6199550-Pleurochrysis_carterae.AAC.1